MMELHFHTGLDHVCRRAFPLILCLLMAFTASGQLVMPSNRFDSIYQDVFDAAGSDSIRAQKGLELLTLGAVGQTPIQVAMIKYLQYCVLHADKTKLERIEREMFSPSHPGGMIDSLILVSRKYLERSIPDRAIPLLLQAIDSLSAGHQNTALCTILLSEAYRQKREYAKGIDLLNGLFTGNTTLSDAVRAYAFNRKAALYNEWSQPRHSYIDSVFVYSERCLSISESTGDKPNLAAAQNELSFLYIRNKEYDKAFVLSMESIRNFEESGMPFHAMNAMINLSHIYRAEHTYEMALKTLVDAISMSDIEQNPNLYLRLYSELSGICLQIGDLRDAFEMLTIGYRLQGGFFRDRIDMQINEQSAKYDLLIKEQRIREEKQINAFQHRQLILLVVLLISLFIAFITILLYIRLKRRGSIRQKLMEAVVETETRERKRIARDLHDGLGPELSAINHYFQAFLDARQEDREAIRERLQKVISGSIEEVSRISHNISPHVLENNGLQVALMHYFVPFFENNGITIDFQANLPERFNLNKELTLYRCITELFHNTLKHAKATHVVLKISAGTHMIHVWYFDNGKGFQSTNKPASGMGLDNIRHRIESFGGKFSLESAPGNGFKATIELPV